MKNLSFLNVLMMAFAIFALSSCGSDDEQVLKPTVSFVDEAGFLSIDSDVAPGADFSVRLTVGKQDNPINSLTIQQDGANVSADRLIIVGLSTVNNPQLVTGADVDGFTWDITITAHTEESDSPYDFIVADSENNSSTATIYINTVGTGVAPTVSIDGPTALTAVASSAQIVKINATAGSSKLASIAVYEDGTLIADLTRLDYEGGNFLSNPESLIGSDVDELVSEEITLRLTDTGATYTFEVTDDGGLTGSADLVVAIGTEIDDELTGQLLNQAGPPGTGGLDLDINDGGVGSMDASAEIADQGIDLSQPDADNWKQQITGVNGSVIRLATNLPDGSGYADITTKEQIEGAYDSSDDLVDHVVAIGDEFVVKNGDNYYFLLVTDINVTAADNADYYEFSIKK